MLNKVKTLNSYKLASLDGEIGKVKEFYFDERHWAIRYLVADTAGNNCLRSRQVLISPYALAAVIEEEQHIAIDLTQKQIESSPSLDSGKPVSRQFEEAYHGYFGWPNYWEGPYMWGVHPSIVRDREKRRESAMDEKAWDPYLRSTKVAMGYHIQASDGEIGHVEDFIIDDETWAIRYLVIDTPIWWLGKKVLISTKWIDRVRWSESKVFINLSRETIQKSPEYTAEFLLTREYETRLHGHYHLQGYWVDESVRKEGQRLLQFFCDQGDTADPDPR